MQFTGKKGTEQKCMHQNPQSQNSELLIIGGPGIPANSFTHHRTCLLLGMFLMLR